MKCERCGGENARLVYRLVPKNFHRVRRLMCPACRVRYGYAWETYGRSFGGVTAPGANPFRIMR